MSLITSVRTRFLIQIPDLTKKKATRHLMTSRPLTIASIQVTLRLVKRLMKNAAVTAMNKVQLGGYIREVTFDKEVCVVAVVGVGMAGAPGIAGRIFTALGKAEVNVMMISQGSSEANVSFVVAHEDGRKALRVLHDEFRLSEDVSE